MFPSRVAGWLLVGIVLLAASSAFGQFGRSGGSQIGRSARPAMQRSQGPWGGGIRSPRRPPPPSQGRNPDLGFIPDLVGAGIKALAEADDGGSRRPHRPFRQRDYDDDDDDYYQPQYSPAPVYVPQAPAPVTPKANPKPPEKTAATKGNKKPSAAFNLVDKLELKLADQVVEHKAQEALSDLTNRLGDATKDPKVAALLEEAKEKIKAGEVLDKKWQRELVEAARQSGYPLPVGKDAAKLDALVKDIRGLSAAHAILCQPFPAGGFVPVFPTGIVQIVLMPSLPNDDVCVLPDGCLMVGTGGEGVIDVVEGNGAEVLGLPLGVGEPEPESSADVATRPKSGVLLMNPADNGGAINFVVGNANYTLQPGYTQQLAEGQTWVIRFDRGAGQGEAKYSLKDGTFVFGPSDRGWELRSKTFSVAIDNRDNEGSFNYIVDNSPQELAAGEKKVHTSSYPILIRFNRGAAGKEGKKRVVEREDNLSVAVNPQDSLWDLYPTDQVAATKSTVGARPVSDLAKDKSRTARLKALLQASRG